MIPGHYVERVVPARYAIRWSRGHYVRVQVEARRVVRDLFGLLVAEPDCLPTEWRAMARTAGSGGKALVVTDYIAGITDRFALDEHRKLFDVQARAS